MHQVSLTLLGPASKKNTTPPVQLHSNTYQLYSFRRPPVLLVQHARAPRFSRLGELSVEPIDPLQLQQALILFEDRSTQALRHRHLLSDFSWMRAKKQTCHT